MKQENSGIDVQALYGHFKNSSGISVDTRKINPGNIFFALKGPNFNGNTYAAKALDLGATFAIIDEEQYHIDERTIYVPDVLKSLQQLANYYRRQLKIPIIGIAGSNGKTTSKELIHGVLSKKYKTFATKGNLNNHIGVPLSLLSISDEIEIAVLELGANHEKELALLCTIAEPDYGLITNNGLDHLEGYGSLVGVIRGNSEIYQWLKDHKGTIFINSKDGILVEMTTGFANAITYGNTGDFFNGEIKENTLFLKVSTDENLEIATHLIGDYNLDNINAALCIGRFFKVPSLQAARAIEEYVPSNNRSQLLEKDTNMIVLDCYNANPSSMEKSIQSFGKQPVENKILMLGDMFELGEYSAVEHLRIIELAAVFNFSAIYFCGSEFYNSNVSVPNGRFFKERTDLEKYLITSKPEHASILIKGSRGMAMEKLVDFL